MSAWIGPIRGGAPRLRVSLSPTYAMVYRNPLLNLYHEKQSPVSFRETVPWGLRKPPHPGHRALAEEEGQV